MAAYAALLSLTKILHDLQNHPSPPISIDPKQLQSLSQILTFLQEFLENSKYPVADDDEEADPFEMRIADAAYAVEDVIESHIVNTIRTRHQQAAEDVSESHLIHHQQTSSVAARISRFFNFFRSSKKQENIDNEADPFEMRIAEEADDVIESHSVDFIGIHHQQTSSIAEDEQAKGIKFYQDLQQVIEEMDLIKKMAVEMNAERAVAVHTQNASVSAVPLRSAASSSSSTAMVCPDAVLYGLMDKLVGGRLDRDVIPIVGMGGIGKTTLALHIYERRNIKDHFDRRAWVTISQKYTTRDLLCEVLAHFTSQNKEQLGEKSEGDLGVELHQHLSYRRYILVMDDVWSIDTWEQIQQFLPEDKNGSRILVTTRLLQLSSQLNREDSLEMEFLDEGSSWELFSKIVFGDRSCPPHLMEIGKKIVHDCRGLPLSIVVVGGLLKKMAHTRESWGSVRDNLISVVNMENDKHCLRLLKLSYNHLPVYLKPCFLYMVMFEEDAEIRVSTIIKLWISEGFLKPRNDRSLEEIAMEFLKDLVDRNLILIHRFGCTGNIKSCKIHDLLRDLCLKEGEKEGFYHTIGHSQGMKRQCRRIVIPKNTSEEEVVEGLQFMPHVRSVIGENWNVLECPNFKLLRTFHASILDDSPNVFPYVNLQHIAFAVHSRSSIFSTLNLFWNLHTLIVPSYGKESTMPAEIWKRPQLRHIEFPGSQVCLPDPPPSKKDEDVVIMENLQVIKGVENFMFSEEVVKRIPNLKKLKTRYWELDGRLSILDDCYCVSNFQFLSKLEHLHISRGAPYLYKLSFPNSLKSLTLYMYNEFEWEMIIEKIGSLPHLEKLKLWGGWFRSGKWEIMVEGQFQELKYLVLGYAVGLKQWIVEDSSVLPRLEHLFLYRIDELEEFPIEIGNITTLQKVELVYCSEEVVRSGREMVDEQVELQGDQLSFHVYVRLYNPNEALQRLSTPNITVVIHNLLRDSA